MSGLGNEGGAEAPILLGRDGPVRILTINRPHARNALDAGAVAALKRAFREFERDQSSAVAVLTGADSSFCAGADLKAVARAADYEAWAGDLGGMLGAPLGKPIIAAVEGPAVAGGLGLALYCDLRIAGDGALFGVFCRRFGVPMSDGTTVRLPRVIGQARALDMMLTGRAVDAREALDFGLVTEVTASGGALARAIQLAKQLAALPQLALRSDRLSLLESGGLDLGPALRNERAHAEAAKRGEAAAGASRFSAGAGRHGAALNRDAASADRTDPDR